MVDGPIVLSLAQLRGLLADLADLARPEGGIAAASVWSVLDRNGLAELPTDVVATLLAAATEPGRPVSAIPLKQLERLLDRIG